MICAGRWTKEGELSQQRCWQFAVHQNSCWVAADYVAVNREVVEVVMLNQRSILVSIPSILGLTYVEALGMYEPPAPGDQELARQPIVGGYKGG